MLTLVLFLIFVIVVAARWFQGLWSNAITLINLLLAMMLAFNYFEPVAELLEGVDRSYTYLWDFVALWGLLGRSILSLWIAWLLVSFICAALHTAPLGPHPLGFQRTPTAGSFLGLAPDRYWLGFMQSRSRGALSRGESDPKKLSPLEQDRNAKVRIFDPESKFVLKYYHRRVEFAGEPEYRVAR